MGERKVILVTGASSGIGQSIAGALAQVGHTVFGTSRNPAGIEKVTGVAMVPLDVCLDESVSACVNAVVEQAGRLDVLVNNAGLGMDGALEEATLEQAKALFETNFFGVMRMVKAVLPTMRRQGRGQIINMSTGMALNPPPFVGLYAASKCALEGYTEALRHELKPLNIQVALVEPGWFKSRIKENQLHGADRISDYDPWRQRAVRVMNQHLEEGADPAIVGNRILRIVESKSPRLRYMVGKEVVASYWGRRVLPESLGERFMRAYYHLDAEK